ncbi:glycerol-3-phosphate dehydrogenase/oxidase [Haloechinothrix sp. LS1_15]|nr:glycerol-3-phosphate dehydrogenase/oxidase [Haloechinothrix sp. LS1_15]
MKTNDSSLNATRRARELSELPRNQPVDVLVIGGGVTGAGVALDAATRGLSVVLAEKHDLAFGTSRWSSKLVHGGLRYLASGAVGIAHESAVERGILIDRTAPHLVRPLPQLVPLLPTVSRRQAALVRAGFLAGDVLRATAWTSHQTLPRSRRVTRAEVRRLAPTVRSAGLRGGILGWDGQLTDDVRLVVGLARTAAAHGARVLTRCEAERVTGSGAVLRDTLSGEVTPVEARMVINATGVWAGQLAPDVAMRPSRGTHLVLPREPFGDLAAGLMTPVPGERNRFVFALPAPDHRVYVGLTDEDTNGEVADIPRASSEEVEFLLENISRVLHTPLTREDVLGTFSGLRPLLDTADGRTADVSRKHAVITAPDGLVTVVGGKLTTYRRMAQDALDAALAAGGVTAGRCRTKRLPLVGAGHPAELGGAVAEDVPRPPDRLVRRYGNEASAVLAEAGGDRALLGPIADGVPTSHAELLFGLHHEGALDEGDLLDRRTRIGLSTGDRERALPLVTDALGHTPV